MATLTPEAQTARVQDAQGFLTTVLDTIDVAVVACDAAGRLTLFNAAAQRFHDMPVDPTLDTHSVAGHYNLFAEDGATPLAHDEVPLFRALARGDVDDAVIVIAAEAMPARVVRCTARQLHDADGTVTGAVVAMTDITAATAAARAVERAHREMRQALDSLPRAVVLVDVSPGGTLHVRWVNAAVRRTYDRPRDSFRGERLETSFPVVGEGHREELLAVARTGVPCTFPVELPGVGGSDPGSFDITVVQWREGGLLIDAEDVTARRLAERALQASEQRLRDAQVAVGLGAWDWDLRTGEVVCTPLLYAMFGVDPDVAVTMEWLVGMVHPDDRTPFGAAVASALRSGATTTLDFRIVRPDGEVRHIRTWISVTRDADGRARHAWGTDQDVTHSQTRELELRAQARTDPLTRLANRRAWEEHLASALTPSTVVAILDLDAFKAYNDTHGHPVGDILLVDAASAWAAYLASSAPKALLARIGGEEFALAVPGATVASARQLLTELCALTPAGQTTSAGLTLVVAGDDPASVMARADAALYAAKRGGRNRVEALAAA